MSDAPSKVPVVISAAGVKKAQVDFVAEMFAMMDTPRLFGGLAVPPPTLGVLTLWELSGNQFYFDPYGCGYMELARALWICTQREHARAAVERYVYADDALALDEGARDVITSGGEQLISELPELITYTHTIMWEGFRMRPQDQDVPEPTQFIYDGEKLGGLLAMAAEVNLTPFDILWRTPMTQLGHIAAALDKRAGREGVERPYDHDDVVSRLKAAVETGENLYNG